MLSSYYPSTSTHPCGGGSAVFLRARHHQASEDQGEGSKQGTELIRVQGGRAFGQGACTT